MFKGLGYSLVKSSLRGRNPKLIASCQPSYLLIRNRLKINYIDPKQKKTKSYFIAPKKSEPSMTDRQSKQKKVHT